MPSVNCRDRERIPRLHDKGMPWSRADSAGTEAQREVLCLQPDCTTVDKGLEMKALKPLAE